jgi:cofilin
LAKRKKIYQFIIFKIDEKLNHVTVDKLGGLAENYDSFTASLPRV